MPVFEQCHTEGKTSDSQPLDVQKQAAPNRSWVPPVLLSNPAWQMPILQFSQITVLSAHGKVAASVFLFSPGRSLICICSYIMNSATIDRKHWLGIEFKPHKNKRLPAASCTEAFGMATILPKSDRFIQSDSRCVFCYDLQLYLQVSRLLRTFDTCKR